MDEMTKNELGWMPLKGIDPKYYKPVSQRKRDLSFLYWMFLFCVLATIATILL